MTDPFTAAVGAQVLAATAHRRELLESLVATSRAIFRAEASSIALLDRASGDFVFQAVAGQGAGDLVGSRFPAGQGLGGTVAETTEPVIVDDLARDPRFARDVAEETGYVPRAMMIAPLTSGEETTGLLYVLDRGDTGRPPLEELGLLVAFADQAARAIDVGEAARRAALLLEDAEGRDPGLAAVARVAERLQGAPPERRAAAAALLQALEELLG